MIQELNPKHPALIGLRVEEEKLAKLFAARAEKETVRDSATEKYLIAHKLPQRDRLSDEVDELLGAAPAERLPTPQSIEKAEHDIAVLTAAIERQSQIVDKARGKYSLELCAANHAQYVTIEKKLLSAVEEVAEWNEKELRFFEELRDAGANSISFRRMAVNAIGVKSEAYGLAQRHRRELAEFVPEAV